MLVADLLTYLGRLHPLVVHLPIGTLILALLLDVLSYRSKREALAKATRLTLLIGFISAVVACLFGYILSLTVSYDTDTLDKHMYAGIVLAIGSGALYFIVLPSKAFTASLIIMVVLVAFTGHEGGMLTHGPDYFSMRSEIPGEPVAVYDTVDMTLVRKLRDKNVTIRVMLQRPLMLDVTIMPESHVNIDDIVNDLNAVASNVILFNASANNLKDDDLKFLGAFVNLEKLRLEKNPVTDHVIDNLVGLKHLEAVNLYDTKVTDAGVKKLRTNPSVKRVYLWGTKAWDQ
jgi:uncharacterized membrane protein